VQLPLWRLHDSFPLANKELVITGGDDGSRKPLLLDTVLHAAHAAYEKILICTVDTDVVLAVALAGTLKEEIEVWVSISTGKSFRVSAGHEIARALGPEKAQALPMFDALTDCDTVSCFAGHGQKTAWIVWTVDSSTRADQTLTLLSTVPDHIDAHPLFYDRTSTVTDIDEARRKRKLFAKKSHITLIHPQVQPWSNTVDEQYTKADRHQHCHH